MKKIMFNDKCGLTKAVLEGRKTMTRRIVPDGISLGNWEETVKMSCYKVGEVVAVAQCYLAIHNEMMDDSFGEGYGDAIYDPFRWAIVDDKPGWSNKMFVRADLMPHQIRITNVRMERLQDISDEDCLLEGVERIDNDDELIYKAFDTKGGFVYSTTPKGAFSALINKVCGEETWKINPLVFVYEFKLVK